jgi:F-type H+-transporting ATPase subunit delta
MVDAVSRHYAGALANAVFARGSGLSAEQAVEQLNAVTSLISGSKELQVVLLSPAVTKSRKQAVITRLVDELGVHRLIRNFLLVIASHRRIRDLKEIQKNFNLIVDERLGWIPAEIASAKELAPEQREQIERVLGSKLGKFIRAQYKVEPTLIGGVRARVASREYDATIRGKIDSLRQRLVAHL